MVLIDSRWRWLSERYVAIKINAGERPGCKNVEMELEISKLLSKPSSHHGRHFVRTLLDSFSLQGPDCMHSCLVFQPLREPLWMTQTRFKTGTIPPEILKVVLHMILHGLDYLHTECQVIHTGTSRQYHIRWWILLTAGRP
jgi:serine/threonine-protein kinase SRPK3